MDILIKKIDQLNETIVLMETSFDNYIASNDLKFKAINETLQSKNQNINQLDETMMNMQTNFDTYITSNDLALQAINDTLQYVVKTPIVIMVPNSEEIDNHRSEFSKLQSFDLI